MRKIQQLQTEATPAGANLEENIASNDWYGDKIARKQNKNTIRIGFQNLGNLPKEPKSHKSTKFIAYLIQKDFDIFGMAEVGLN